MKSALAEKKCKACHPGTPALTPGEISLLLPEIPGWDLFGSEIAKVYKFPNYHHTMAFVNAVAWLAHREDHHPDMEVGFNRCKVKYSTHAVGGLSENDFICAAKVDELLA